MQFSALLLLAGAAMAHLPFMDDGSHTTYQKAFEYPDETIARTLNINFDCPSLPVYTKVAMQNTTTFVLKYGMTNDTEIIDYRPNVWVIGKTVSVPKALVNSTENAQGNGPYGVTIPPGYKGYRIYTGAEDLFNVAEGEGLSFAILGSTSVNVTETDDVYVVIEPTEQRRSRFWLGIGKTEMDEEKYSEPDEVDDLVLEAFHEPLTFPKLGEQCVFP